MELDPAVAVLVAHVRVVVVLAVPERVGERGLHRGGELRTAARVERLLDRHARQDEYERQQIRIAVLPDESRPVLQRVAFVAGLGVEGEVGVGPRQALAQSGGDTIGAEIARGVLPDVVGVILFGDVARDGERVGFLAAQPRVCETLGQSLVVGPVGLCRDRETLVLSHRVGAPGSLLEEVLDPSIQSLNWLESTGKPYVMARIINIRKTVRLLGFQGEGRKILKITDQVLEENNGFFILTYGHGNVKLDKVKEEQLMEDIEFDLTIGELSAHIFGYKIIEGLPLVCKKDSFFINDYL